MSSSFSDLPPAPLDDAQEKEKNMVTVISAASTADALTGTFTERLQAALNEKYTVNMRRSVQTCVLLEADRCLKKHYKRLKAFQRKFALHDTASDIVDTLTFIPPHFRREIMYRTASSMSELTPELTWRRMKNIEREISRAIIPKILALADDTKTHEEVCKLYLQQEYEKTSGRKEPYHPNWEYSHDNHFTAYRMYYIGKDLNPNVPAAIDPNPQRVVPSVKPSGEERHIRASKRHAASEAVGKASPAPPVSSPKKARVSTPKAATGVDELTERRALLKEIKDHVELLKEFKDIIPEDELNERKKSLYDKLPEL
mmetsp:Transcript_30049/g.34919  ORF Transcript_30049/g.34919 Transcript_30049/m.34919 type:complete len:314 (+) Transcript_30049:254-1195(+)